MVINKSSWHFSLFLLIRFLWDKFTNDGSLTRFQSMYAYREWYLGYNGKSRVDLCTYIRTICVYGPAYLLLMAIPIGLVSYFLFVWPSSELLLSVWQIIGIVSGGFLVIFCLVWVAKKIIEASASRLHERKKRREEYRPSRIETELEYQARKSERIAARNAKRAKKAAKAPGFFKVFIRWVIDRHNNFCSFIEVE